MYVDQFAVQLLHQERRRVRRQMRQQPIELVGTPGPALQLAQQRLLGLGERGAAGCRAVPIVTGAGYGLHTWAIITAGSGYPGAVR
jgi:hypothetical protein